MKSTTSLLSCLIFAGVCGLSACAGDEPNHTQTIPPVVSPNTVERPKASVSYDMGTDKGALLVLAPTGVKAGEEVSYYFNLHARGALWLDKNLNGTRDADEQELEQGDEVSLSVPLDKDGRAVYAIHGDLTALGIAFDPEEDHPISYSEVTATSAPHLQLLEWEKVGLRYLSLSPEGKELRRISISEHSLPIIDLPKEAELLQFLVRDGALRVLDLRRFSKLTDLNVMGNKLEHIDIPKDGSLHLLQCSGNALSELDLSGQPKLWRVFATDNKLKTVKLESVRNTTLELLALTNNQLQTMDTRNYGGLKTLYIDRNELKSLRVDYGTEVVDCSNNALEEIDLSPNVGDRTFLKVLDCPGNPQLKRLILTGNTSLSDLDVQDCPLLLIEALAQSLPQTQVSATLYLSTRPSKQVEQILSQRGWLWMLPDNQ